MYYAARQQSSAAELKAENRKRKSNSRVFHNVPLDQFEKDKRNRCNGVAVAMKIGNL